MDTAQTIQAQIGGKAFFMMGAKNLMADVDSLQWKVGRNGKGVTHVTVKLAANDTYTVTFHACRGTKIRVVAEVEGVYVDGLHRVIEQNTELYLSL